MSSANCVIFHLHMMHAYAHTLFSVAEVRLGRTNRSLPYLRQGNVVFLKICAAHVSEQICVQAALAPSCPAEEC